MDKKRESRIDGHFALLIGVDEYDDPFFQSLPQTTHDVVGLENLLIQFGYTVQTLHGRQEAPESRPTKVNIEAAMGKFFQEDRRFSEGHPGDLLLVYFGGHGVLEKGKAYLVPSDGCKSKLAESAIDLEGFKKKIVEALVQAKILFLDTCHAGIARVRDAGGMSPEFARHIFLEAEGTATLAACMRHECAHHYHIAPNGVFTHYLLEGLEGKAAQKGKRFITFNDLENYVTHKVRTWAEGRGKRQTPNSHSRLVGDPPLAELDIKSEMKQKGPSPLLHNPFTETLAIRDPVRFIGRKTETRRLWTLLQGGSVALRGDPKIGKSSMMLHLVRQWDGPKVGPINFDQLDGPEDFYMYIARAVGLENSNWSAICETLEDAEMLLLLDELDVAPKRGITHEDMSHFRALCEHNRNFKIVAVSRAPLKEVFPDTGVGSPFYNLLQPLTVKELNRDDALSLLEHPWAPEAKTFDKATCEELLSTAGLHPFKLQRAAFHYYEYLNDPTHHWKEAYQQDMEQML